MYLFDGYVRVAPAARGRVYSFLISVSNPSDSNNAIARLDLRINYRTAANFLAAVDIPLSSTDGESSQFGAEKVFTVPLRIDAHQTVTGWAHFEVKEVILKNCVVDRYAVMATDSQGERSEIDCGIIKELANEAEAAMG